MARVPYLNREDLPEKYREIFDRVAEQRGQPVGNIYRTLAHTPNLLKRFVSLGGHLRSRTALDPKLRELAILTVGRLTNAEYEFVHHWNIALRAGVPREQLEQLGDFETAQAFDEHERAVMRYAVEATSNVKVSDATFNTLRSFLDDRRILELAQSVAFYNMVVRILVPLGVELEPGIAKE